MRCPRHGPGIRTGEAFRILKVPRRHISDHSGIRQDSAPFILLIKKEDPFVFCRCVQDRSRLRHAGAHRAFFSCIGIAALTAAPVEKDPVRPVVFSRIGHILKACILFDGIQQNIAVSSFREKDRSAIFITVCVKELFFSGQSH